MRPVRETEVILLRNVTREHLIQARINQQRSVVLADWIEQKSLGATPADRDISIEWARYHRFFARRALLRIEVLNGRAVVRGESTLPLRDILRGKDYRGWGEYERGYGASKMFQGVDPCA